MIAAPTRQRCGLADIQSWMQTLIMHPAGVGRADRCHEDDPAVPCVARTLTRSRQLSAIERLEIYNHAYHSRLVECLESEFSIVRQTIGEDAFTQFSLGYIHEYPSTTYTLGRFSDHFVSYLSATRPESGGDDGLDWSAFLVDLASFEQTINDVFNGPGSEGQSRLSTDAVAQVARADRDSIRLQLDASVRIRTFRFPVHQFYEEMRSGRTPSFPEAGDTDVAFHRSNFIVKFFPLERSQAVLLTRLLLHSRLDDAISAAHSSATGSAESVAAELYRTMHAWTVAGIFLAPAQLPHPSCDHFGLCDPSV